MKNKKIKIKIPKDISFDDLKLFLTSLNKYVMNIHDTNLSVKFNKKDTKPKSSYCLWKILNSKYSGNLEIWI